MADFIHFIVQRVNGLPAQWVDKGDTPYYSLSPKDKSLFLLHQAVILAYLDLAYQGLPTSNVTAYRDKVIYQYMPAVAFHIQTADEPDEVAKQAYEQVERLLNRVALHVDADVCLDLLQYQTDTEIPIAGDLSFYRPFLKFMERAYRADAFDEKFEESENFTIKETVTAPSFGLSGRYLAVLYDQKFPGYKYSYSATNRYSRTAFGRPCNSILSYWLGYDMKGRTMNEVLGFLASNCIELDINAIPEGSIQWLYYDMYKLLFGWVPPVSDQRNPLKRTNVINDNRHALITFLFELRKRYDLEFEDPKLISKLIGTDYNTPGTPELRQFLEADDKDSVSAEAYRVFKNSIFGACPELDLLTDGRVALRKRLIQSGKLFDLMTAQESLSADAGQGTAPYAASLIRDGSHYSLEADTDHSPVDDPAAGDDSTTDDDKSADTAETAETETPSSNPESLPVEGNDTSEKEEVEVPPLPEVGSKHGLTLELTQTENMDTFLYRMEIGRRISNIIKNPPPSLSEQKIAILKRIKAYFLNSMSVQVLHDVLLSVLDIPKILKPRKPED